MKVEVLHDLWGCHSFFEADKCLLLFWSPHPFSILMCEMTDCGGNWCNVLGETGEILSKTKKTTCFSGIPGRTGIDKGGNFLVICIDAVCREAKKKSIDDWLNRHLSGLAVRLFSLILWRAARKALSWSVWLLPNTIMSSDVFLTPLIPYSTSSLDFWKISAAELTPKLSRL